MYLCVYFEFIMMLFAQKIAVELNLSLSPVEKTIRLLEEGATIPFIARYRKEVTGSLDETVITAIRDRHKQLVELEKRREVILASIEEQGKLSEPLKQKILQAQTMTELEDLYLPYKPKRKTRASIAIAKGLEPLAQMIFEQKNISLSEEAKKFIATDKGVDDTSEALAGARDIIAEWVHEDLTARNKIRHLFMKEAEIVSKVMKNKEAEGANYQPYFEFSEPIAKSPSHRILAMFRGENEGFLKLHIAPDAEKAIDILQKQFVFSRNDCGQQTAMAVEDSYKRLLSSSIETEIRHFYKEKADQTAIRVFAENLRQLLLMSPLGKMRVLAIDPGFRTGCKVVCLDAYGNFLHFETIYPHPPQNENKQAAAKISQLIEAYKIEAIAIGNGTAGRETEGFIKHIHFPRQVVVVVVNESGASVYSASGVAREEFPSLDVTVRGAISIGRRLMDPLAELVKIDPKSIGVGQYQHDVDQTLLKDSLQDVVESCVNSVGVDINTASKQLLSYVSGIGESLAQNIITYRTEHGPFRSRAELKKISRFGPKAFEQSAGFLRIPDAENILDRSAVHPESYHIVEQMAKQIKGSIMDLVSDKKVREKIELKQFITDKVGLPTLHDIIQELDKPGRDPRSQFEMFEFDSHVNTISDLTPGMELPGIVTNITAFGAFVDIGVHQDGLVHISQLADRYISNPNEVVKLNQKVKVKVIEVDIPRKRIQLSMKL